MKAIVLATLATIITSGLAVLVFQLAHIERRALTLLLIYLLVACVLTAVSLTTPQDLDILPPELVAEPPLLDFVATLFFYSAAFFGGVLQLYNLADRGLSLRILIDVLERGSRGATMTELFDGYGGGRGMTWMYDKRVHGMVQSGLAHVAGGALVLTERGHATAAVYAMLRRMLRTG